MKLSSILPLFLAGSASATCQFDKLGNGECESLGTPARSYDSCIYNATSEDILGICDADPECLAYTYYNNTEDPDKVDAVEFHYSEGTLPDPCPGNPYVRLQYSGATGCPDIVLPSDIDIEEHCFIKSCTDGSGCGGTVGCTYEELTVEGLSGMCAAGLFSETSGGDIRLYDGCFYAGGIAANEPLCTNDANCLAYTTTIAEGAEFTFLHFSDGRDSCPGVSLLGGLSLKSGIGCPIASGRSDAECFQKSCTDPLYAEGGCGGDPHIVLFGGKHYNYHGECDLVLVSSKSFQGGDGLDIHVRTKLESFYSIVTAVGIKAGKNTFEFNHETVNSPKYFMNGKGLPDLPYEDDQFKATSDFVHNEDHNRVVQIIKIKIGDQASLHITVMDQWVHVTVKATDIMDSKGLMGSFPDGKMLARDGVTDLNHDRNAFGSQWQIQEDEPKLFHWIPEGHPQAPDACKMPLEDAHTYLRTRSMELYNMAVQACKQEGLSGLDLEDCVFDVSVMNNPKIAAGWWAAKKK